jgi:hypothetical protein
VNLDSIQTANVSPKPVSAPRPGQHQIDITSAEPAVPAPQANDHSRPAGVAASIKGVLTSDEEHAIANMFASGTAGYSSAGTAASPPTVPGLRLNLQA